MLVFMCRVYCTHLGNPQPCYVLFTCYYLDVLLACVPPMKPPTMHKLTLLPLVTKLACLEMFDKLELSSKFQVLLYAFTYMVGCTHSSSLHVSSKILNSHV